MTVRSSFGTAARRLLAGLDPAHWTEPLVWGALSAIVASIVAASVSGSHQPWISAWMTAALPVAGIISGRGRGSTWPATLSWVLPLFAWTSALVLQVLPPAMSAVGVVWFGFFFLRLPPTPAWEKVADRLVARLVVTVRPGR